MCICTHVDYNLYMCVCYTYYMSVARTCHMHVQHLDVQHLDVQHIGCATS